MLLLYIINMLLDSDQLQINNLFCWSHSALTIACFFVNTKHVTRQTWAYVAPIGVCTRLRAISSFGFTLIDVYWRNICYGQWMPFLPTYQCMFCYPPWIHLHIWLYRLTRYHCILFGIGPVCSLSLVVRCIYAFIHIKWLHHVVVGLTICNIERRVGITAAAAVCCRIDARWITFLTISHAWKTCMI